MKLMPSATTHIPVKWLQTNCFQKSSFGVLTLVTVSTLFGCASLPGNDKSIDATLDPAGNSAIIPENTGFGEPDENTDDSSLASTQNPAGPVIGAQCDINAELGTTINALADDLTNQKIPYTLGEESIGEWRDCSGVFLRFSSALAESCPVLESRVAASAGVAKYTPGEDNQVTGVEARGQRSTRSIAQWYNSQGGFTPVTYASPANAGLGATDADIARLVDIRDRIKVGSVLWFSYQKPQIDDDTQLLFSNRINHMGVVTKVITDKNGELERYEMFHGHGKRNDLAERTTEHFWKWPSNYRSYEKYPPLGFWGQYLVGIAPVFAGPTDAITLSSN